MQQYILLLCHIFNLDKKMVSTAHFSCKGVKNMTRPFVEQVVLLSTKKE